MKPNTVTAMHNLIQQARARLPFTQSFDGHCEGRCEECAFKLLEFLDIDLCCWERRLQKGDTPSLGALHSLARDCQQTYDILHRQGLTLDAAPAEPQPAS